MRIIGLCIIYDGQQFLEETLNGMVRRIRDLNHIVFVDGAWLEGGDSPQSTDDTFQIIEKFARIHQNIEVITVYHPKKRLWRNPSEKRNYGLKIIDEMFNDDDYFVFFFDDDEEIRFRNGKEETWLRDYLKNTNKDLFILTTYGWNVEKGMLTIRFIRGGKGYHWHSERAMQIHDKDCNILLDWTPGQEQYFGQVDTAEMYIINKWNKRDHSTLRKRDHYAAIENKLLEDNLPCIYRNLVLEN